MPFDFELTFAGLCVFTITGDREKPDEINVLLVKAHHHAPRLVYRPRDGREPFTKQRRGTDFLYPEVGGRDIAIRGLSEEMQTVEELTVKADQATHADLEVSWRSAADQIHLDNPPDKKEDEPDWLDWIPSLRETDSRVPEPGRAVLDPKNIIVQVKLEAGRLSSKRILRRWKGEPDAGKPIVWTLDHGKKQGIAELTKLTISGVQRYVDILSNRGVGHRVRLGDEEGMGKVFASITNLPPRQLPTSIGNSLRHFHHFYDIFDWSEVTGGQPNDLKSPSVPSGGGGTGSSGACTQGRYP
jgi:hypothetical protein